MKHYRKKCHNCKKTKWCTLVPNPYLEDVKGIKERHWYCEKCLKEITYEI